MYLLLTYDGISPYMMFLPNAFYVLDIWMKKGDGGESIYGPVFEGKSFLLKSSRLQNNMHIHIK